MRIILLKDIKGVGRKFEEKSVADGYALNKLIPQKLAVPADGPGASSAKALKEQEERARARRNEALSMSVSKIAGQTIELKVRANEKGHLFEKVTAGKLGELVGIDEDLIDLESPIKELGSYEIPVGKTKFTLVLHS